MDGQNYRRLSEHLRCAERALDAALATYDPEKNRAALTEAREHLQPVALGLGLDIPAWTEREFRDPEELDHALWSLRNRARKELHLRRPAAVRQRIRQRRKRVLQALVVCGVLAVIVLKLWAWLSPEGLNVIYYRGADLRHARWRAVERSLSKGYERVWTRWWVPRSSFSARWNGWLLVPEDAEYTFAAQHRDGLRLFLDNELLIDNWAEQPRWGASLRKAERKLTKGPHRLKVEHYVSRAEGGLDVRWTGGGIPVNSVLAAPYLRKRP